MLFQQQQFSQQQQLQQQIQQQQQNQANTNETNFISFVNINNSQQNQTNLLQAFQQQPQKPEDLQQPQEFFYQQQIPQLQMQLQQNNQQSSLQFNNQATQDQYYQYLVQQQQQYNMYVLQQQQYMNMIPQQQQQLPIQFDQQFQNTNDMNYLQQQYQQQIGNPTQQFNFQFESAQNPQQQQQQYWNYCSSQILNSQQVNQINQEVKQQQQQQQQLQQQIQENNNKEQEQQQLQQITLQTPQVLQQQKLSQGEGSQQSSKNSAKSNNSNVDENDKPQKPVMISVTQLKTNPFTINNEKLQKNNKIEGQEKNKNNNNNHIEQKLENQEKNQNNQEEEEKVLENDLDVLKFVCEEVTKNASSLIIEYADITFESQIGSGSSASVFKGQWQGSDIAIKKVKFSDLKEQNNKEFTREISALMKLRPHQHVVSLLGVSYSTSGELCILTEFCQGGTLFSLLHKNLSIVISWQQRLKFAKDIAAGMSYLHSIKPSAIIHRDLKSLNILLDKEFKTNDKNDISQVNLKIVDFGLARNYEQSLQMTGFSGTFHWMAPEILENKPYSTKADVYSFAIVLWEIICRTTPYRNLQNQLAIMKWVIENKRPDVSKIPADCPEFLKELMFRCWNQDPEKRPSFEEVYLILKNAKI